MIGSGPIPAGAWRGALAADRSGAMDLRGFRITIAKQTLSRELRAMGYRNTIGPTRHHARAEGAIEDFQKTSPRGLRQLRARRRLTATR